MKKQKVIICAGAPASGKSTWAEKFCKENHEYVRVNKDDLRGMFSQKWSPALEDVVRFTEPSIISLALKRGFNVVVDDVNLYHTQLFNIKSAIKASGVEVDIIYRKFFDTTLEECIERDSKRDKPVGEECIKKYYKMYEGWTESM